MHPAGRGRPDPAAYRAVKLLVLDVDGVLTDNRVRLDGCGGESKDFCLADGTGAALARYGGLKLALLSGRASPVNRRRARQMGIPLRLVYENATVKLPFFLKLLARAGCTEAETAYCGDDLIDLPALGRARIACCPANARPEVRTACHLQTSAAGGSGAARELIEHLLKRRGDGSWERARARYLGLTSS